MPIRFGLRFLIARTNRVLFNNNKHGRQQPGQCDTQVKKVDANNELPQTSIAIELMTIAKFYYNETIQSRVLFSHLFCHSLFMALWNEWWISVFVYVCVLFLNAQTKSIEFLKPNEITTEIIS